MSTWTYQDVLKTAVECDRLARRLNCRFVPDPEKLRALGLTEPQITSIQFHMAPVAPVRNQCGMCGNELRLDAKEGGLVCDNCHVVTVPAPASAGGRQ